MSGDTIKMLRERASRKLRAFAGFHQDDCAGFPVALEFFARVHGVLALEPSTLLNPNRDDQEFQQISLASARKVADEIAMLFEGQIIWRGPASSIDHSGHDHVDQFVHGRADGPIQPAI